MLKKKKEAYDELETLELETIAWFAVKEGGACCV